MFKKIFSAAKNLLRSPVGQIGIGLLLPGMAGMSGIAGGIGKFALANPMLTQAGIGLLSGDKPENVLRNVAYGSLTRGIGAMGTPEGFMGGVKRGFGMTPGGMTDPIITPQQGGSFTVDGGGSIGSIGSGGTNLPPPRKSGFLEGLIKNTKVITNADGSQSVVPVTDFFEKYGTLLKLGSVGATVAAAAMNDEEKEFFYDPNKNPYLKTGSADKDFFEDINPYYSMNKGGGVMDFPEKDGMINGPGDGQSDDIPAMLSDGEFVMTKQAVMAAGNGNRSEGTKKMYDIMNSLEDKARNMGIGRV
tara:strand:+ start:1484 stop:2392 length:909 start_codon:yes stop_codon:yes gene_type:complete